MYNTLVFNAKIIVDSLLGLRSLFNIYRLQLESVKHEGEDIRTFVFRSNKAVTYTAGQYGIWFFGSWTGFKPARLFTIASAPAEQRIQLSTRIRTSPFKQRLGKLSAGDHMYIVGPIGRFVLPKSHPKTVVMIAGGIGITPIRSIIKELAYTKSDTNVELIHSAETFYLFQDELQYDFVTPHYVTRSTLDEQLTTTVKKAGIEVTYYISGAPKFVTSVESTLQKLGVRDIVTDGFLGY